ncbi:MAG: anti-sigma factor antagonist, partial [Candidatus Kryptonium sp.]
AYTYAKNCLEQNIDKLHAVANKLVENETIDRNEFEEVMKKLVEGGSYKLVVNMKNLSYISSAGFGVFMAFVDEVRKKGGDIKFCCLSKKIDEIFDLLGFKHIFSVLNSESEAIKSFEKVGAKNVKGRKK